MPLRIAGAVFVFLCCLAAWKFARDLWGPREGLAAALATGFFLTFGIPSAVMALAPDLLMILPHLAAVYLAWRGSLFWSGLIAGVAMLINAKGVFVLAACALWAGSAWPWLLLGFALPNVAALAWFGQPYFDQVWRWGALYSDLGFAPATGLIRIAQLGRLPGRAGGRRRVRVLEREELAHGGLAVAILHGRRGWLAILSAVLLSTAAGDGAHGGARIRLLGRRRAVLLLLLLIPLVRFGPRYRHARQ